MYRKCVTEISVEHQNQFTESLLELMKKIPFEDITVTQLCQAAGLSRRIFYHLFSSKTGALHALVDHKLLDIGQLPGGTTQFFRYWKDQKDLLDVLSANGMAVKLRCQVGGGHCEADWEKLVPEFMHFLWME